MDQLVIELGNDLFDDLPEAETVDEDYDATAAVDSFHTAVVREFSQMLWDHLQTVIYDWENQRPEYQEG